MGRKEETSDEKIEALLDPEKRAEFKLVEALRSVENNSIVLVVIEAVHYAGIESGLVDFLARSSKGAVFVSVNKPIAQWKKKTAEWLQNPKVLVIDAISEASGVEKPEWPSVRYLEGPQNLVELAELIKKGLSKTGQNSFVVVDSLSTLLLYNKQDSVEKFVHAITGNIRSQKALGILVMLRLKENADIIRMVSQFCDQTIEITETETRVNG